MTETFTGRVPTAEEEDRFWALIEAAWASLGDEPAALRRALRERDPATDPENDELYAIDGFTEEFTARLRAATADLPLEELVVLDRVLERKLYDIDRADIHDVTDGSDDGFLYARGFIVALGREYYEAVRQDPRVAVLDGEWEPMCYFFSHLYSDRTGGDWPDTGSGISRESCNNRAGWPS